MKTKSAALGTRTSAPEVTNVSPHGFWLLVDQKELYLPFSEFPWFRDATIAQLVRLERSAEHHLYWPDLDVDLTLDSIEHPEKYPLVSHERPLRCLRPAVRRRTATAPGQPAKLRGFRGGGGRPRRSSR